MDTQSSARKPVFSLIVTIFKSDPNISSLLDELDAFAKANASEFDVECVFVVDGSPDQSYSLLKERLPSMISFRSQLHNLSRNFGAPFALRCGLSQATGEYFTVLASDLQEPLEMVRNAFLEIRTKAIDICFGRRVAREDPWISKCFSVAYWTLYRWLIEPDIPKGGVDFFVCNKKIRDELLKMNEKNIFVIGLIFWMGFRRSFLPYKRRKRKIGKSTWSFAKRVNYLKDSLFLFSDLPIKCLTYMGLFGLAVSALLAISLVLAKVKGTIPIPGYAATVTVICFFGGLNSFGLGIIGEYLWRTFENTKQRPLSIIMESHQFNYPRREV